MRTLTKMFYKSIFKHFAFKKDPEETLELIEEGYEEFQNLANELNDAKKDRVKVQYYTGTKFMKEKYKKRAFEFYEDTINFCHRWDQSSFDPNYDTISLDDFIPLVGKIFNRVPYRNL